MSLWEIYTFWSPLNFVATTWFELPRPNGERKQENAISSTFVSSAYSSSSSDFAESSDSSLFPAICVSALEWKNNVTLYFEVLTALTMTWLCHQYLKWFWSGLLFLCPQLLHHTSLVLFSGFLLLVDVSLPWLKVRRLNCCPRTLKTYEWYMNAWLMNRIPPDWLIKWSPLPAKTDWSLPDSSIFLDFLEAVFFFFGCFFVCLPVRFFFTSLTKGSSSELSSECPAKQQSQQQGFKTVSLKITFHSCHDYCYGTSSLSWRSAWRCSCPLCVFLHWFLLLGVHQGNITIIWVAVWGWRVFWNPRG